jgi:hypothetical protein
MKYYLQLFCAEKGLKANLFWGSVNMFFFLGEPREGDEPTKEKNIQDAGSNTKDAGDEQVFFSFSFIYCSNFESQRGLTFNILSLDRNCLIVFRTVGSSVADPGCLSWIQDSNFFILDPGSNNLSILNPKNCFMFIQSKLLACFCEVLEF